MYLSKYGVARTIRIAIPKAGSASHAVGADWTPAAGDVKVSKDGGAAANVTNLPTAIAMGNSAIWAFALTATEMEAAEILVTVADSAAKAVDDTGFAIETYGHASAQHAFDLDTSSVAQTGDNFARLGAPAGASVSADVAAVKVDTAATLADTGTDGVVVAAASKTGYALSAAGVQAIWDALSAALTTANSIGKRLVDFVTGDTYGRLGAPAGASVSADIAAIEAQTDDIGAAGAGLTALASAADLAIVAAYLDTEIAAIKAKTDQLTFTVANVLDANALRLNGDATAAANIAKTTRAVARGTVDAAASTTSIPTSAFTPAGVAADQFKGRIVTFDADTTTTALRGQSTDITASSAAATPTLTVTALTTAPAAGDTFSVT